MRKEKSGRKPNPSVEKSLKPLDGIGDVKRDVLYSGEAYGSGERKD